MRRNKLVGLVAIASIFLQLLSPFLTPVFAAGEQADTKAPVSLPESRTFPSWYGDPEPGEGSVKLILPPGAAGDSASARLSSPVSARSGNAPRSKGSTPIEPVRGLALEKPNPGWLPTAPSSGRSNPLIPAWFSAPDAERAVSRPASPVLLPGWFVPPAVPQPGPLLWPSGTIPADDIQVIASSLEISKCDAVAFTVVVTNSGTQSNTNVVVNNSMPTGFSPGSQSCTTTTLAAGASFVCTFVYSATCDAVSGQNTTQVSTAEGSNGTVRVNVAVQPGALTLRKIPEVIPATLGDVVTWNVVIHNAGYGKIANVFVSDTLGSGLSYVGGLTEVSIAAIAAGEFVTLPVSARVVGCQNLENRAYASWGCGGSPCQEFDVDAAIDLHLPVPQLVYTLPTSFDVNYCTGSGVFTIPLTNIGDGTAAHVFLAADMSPFEVSNVSAGASYTTTAQAGFTITDVAPGQTYYLVFTLGLPDPPCSLDTGGSIQFDLGYRDDCDNPFYSLPKSASWNLTNTPGSLGLSKSMPSEAYLGDVVTPTISVAANGIVGSFVVTDQLPSGWTIVDADGGSVFTVGSTTYITWLLSGSTVLNPVLQTPDPAVMTDVCSYCGQSATNIVTAASSDCRDCRQQANASASIQLQCESNGVTSRKAVGPASDTCGANVFTNTYTFGSSWTITPTFGDMVFTETLPYQTYRSGSASVLISDGITSCNATFSEALVGGRLVISSISPTCGIAVPGATMVITYVADMDQANPCDGIEFYDWSHLNVGASGGLCLDDDVLDEGVSVSTNGPEMALSTSGLPAYVSPCGDYTVTLNVERTTPDVPAYDAVLDVMTSTYAVVDVVGFGGQTPVSTDTDSLGYHWDYGDAFSSALTSTVTLHVQLRCGTDPAPFTGTIGYSSRCGGSCSAGGALGIPVRTQAALILTKFPEKIYAAGDVVTWTLTLVNSGAGTAYDVALTDSLGSGLQYFSSTVRSTKGSVTGLPPATTSDNLVTWSLPRVEPSEKVTVEYAAEIVSCGNLTNTFSASQGCQGTTCILPLVDTSEVVTPPGILINTNRSLTPIEPCATRTVTITVRNGGLISVYSATMTETLPDDLHFIAGTVRYTYTAGGIDPSGPYTPGPDPTVTGDALSWGPDSLLGLGDYLKKLAPLDTVYVVFDVYADCPFEGGAIVVKTGYLDVCGNPYETAASSYLMETNRPDLGLVKEGRNATTGSDWDTLVYAEPGDEVVWRLVVRADGGGGHAHEVTLTDSLPSNFNFSSVTYSPAPSVSTASIISWYVGTMAPGSVFTAYVTATVRDNGCATTDQPNVARVEWHCPPAPWQPTGCFGDAIVQAADLRTRPLFPDTGIGVAPSVVNRCGDLITVTLNNQGSPAYSSTLTATLPVGYVYSSTVYASTTPDGSPANGTTAPVWVWNPTALPTGLTTITFRIQNTTTGNCALPAGPITVSLLYNDHDTCVDTGPYYTTTSENLTVASPSLVIGKFPVQQTSGPGRTVTWTLRVTNTGSAAAPNVVITDSVDDSGFSSWGVTPSADSGSGTVADPWVWTRNLAAGASVSFVITAVVRDTGIQRNYAGVVGSCDVGCTYASAITTAYVTQQENFAKSPPVQTGTIGSLVTFTLGADLPRIGRLYQNVILTDALPVGLGFVAASLTYADAAGGPTTTLPTVQPTFLANGNIIWRLGDLSGPAQLSGVITAVITNTSATYNGSSHTNLLTMTYYDDLPYLYTSTARVDVQEPLLHIGKSYVTPYNCNATLLQDSFNRTNGSLAAPWGGGVGIWNIVGGVVRPATGGNQRTYNGDTTWTDYSFSAMISSTDTSGDVGLIFREQSDGNHYRFRWNRTGATTGSYMLERVVGGTATALVTAGSAYQSGRWYHVEVRAVGSSLQVYIDGVLALSATDSTYPTGRIGLYAYNQAYAYFDDVLVTRMNNMACLVGANDLVTYTLVVSNQARLTGYDLVITDAIPSGMSLFAYTMQSDDPASAVEVEPAPIPGATGVLTWGVNQLAARVPFDPLSHTALTLTVVLSVSNGITANAVLPNQAFLSYDNWEDDGDSLGDSYNIDVERDYSGGSHSAAVRTVTGGIVKAVSFDPPPTATLGTLVTYTIIVPASPISATMYNVTVTDTVDSRLRIEGVTTGGGTGTSLAWSGQAITATFASIPHDTLAYITVTARISHEWPSAAGDANSGEIITNTAALSHSTATAITTTRPVTTAVGEPRLVISKTASMSTDDPRAAYYTVTVRNTGNSTAYGPLVIHDLTPANVLITDISDGGLLLSDGRTISWTVGSLTAGASLALTYRLTLSTVIYSGSLFTNTAIVTNTSLTETIAGVRPYVTQTTYALSWPLGRLGDYVWYDFDYDGIQGTSPGEFGINGVVIDLFDSAGNYISSTTTYNNGVNDGYYIFENLPLGVTYTVRISSVSYQAGGPLAPYSQTLLTASGATTATDSNASITATFGGLGYAITTTLTPAFTEDLTLDYGFVRLVEIGNYVWLDENNNGLQDDVTGFSGVTVTVTYPDGRVFTTTTGPGGYYTFTVPISQVYTITVVPENFLPGGPLEAYTNTLTNAGSDDGVDSDGQPVGGGLVTVTPVITGDNYSFDFGLVELVSLGDLVWFDTNNNGVVDGSEVGVPGVIMQLYQDTDGDGAFTPGVDNLISTTTTGAGGYYTFTQLYPSLLPTQTYMVVITGTNFTGGGPLESYINSTATYTGDSDLNDHDHGVVNGTLGSGGYVASTPVTVTAGDEPTDDGDGDDSSNLTIDFGFYKLSLGNRVWYDNDNNGVQNGSEAGAPGVTVWLYDSTNPTTPIATTTTDASGYYTFTGLLSGTYEVEIELPAGYTSSTDIGSSSNPDNNVDSDDNGVNVSGTLVRSNPVTLTPGDGGALGNTQVTDATGSTYNPTVDFGLVSYLSLGDLVWIDANNNGVVDGSEVGVPGVIMQLYQDTDGDGAFTPGVDNLISTTTTGAGGYYTFTNLLPSRYPTETYLVVITSTNFTGGGVLEDYLNSTATYTGDSDLNDHDHGVVNGTLGSGGYVASTPVTLTEGGEPTDDGDSNANSNLTIDFGFHLPGQIGNYVWVDINRDGLQDGSDVPIPGVVVDLYDSTTGAYLGSTTTDGSGLYLFDKLPLGVTYTVQLSSVNFLSGGALYSYTHTIYGGTPFDDTDSNANPDELFNGFGYAVTTTLTEVMTQDLTLDFGFYAGRIGDYVWLDTNHDGLQDSTDIPISGVVVDLYDSTTGGYLGSATTDGSGLYLFDDLPLNVTYTVQLSSVNFLSGGALYPYSQTIYGGAAFDNTDSNADSGAVFGGFGYAVTTTLTSAITEDLTLDFGFYGSPAHWLYVFKSASASTAVWSDYVTFSVRYVITGSETVRDVTIVDQDVNPPYVFVSATGGLSVEHPAVGGTGTVIWHIGDVTPTMALSVTGFVTLVVRVTEPVSDGQVLPNEVWLQEDGNLVTDVVTVTIQAPNLHFVKTNEPSGIVYPSDIITYTICYSNDGHQDAANGVITDYIPANTVYVPGSAAPSPSSGPDPLVWNVGTVPADGSTSCISFRVQISSAIVISGRAFGLTRWGWAPLENIISTTSTVTATATPALTPTPTLTVTATPTATAEPTSTPTPTITPTAETPTITPTPEPSTATPTATPEQPTEEPPTATPTATPEQPTEEPPTATPTATPEQPTPEPPTATPTEEPPTATPEPAQDVSGEPEAATEDAQPDQPSGGETGWRLPVQAMGGVSLWTAFGALQEQPTPTGAPTPEVDSADEQDPTPEQTATPEVIEEEPTATPEPTEEPPTSTPTEEPTATPEPTQEPPTATPTETPTEEPPTATPTTTLEPTITPTSEVTATPTATPEPTVTPTPEVTATLEPTITPTLEVTATPTVTPAEVLSVSIAPPIGLLDLITVSIVNSATMTTDQTGVLSDSVTNPLTGTVDPHITKHGSPTLARIGDVVTFTIYVSNTGSINATGVRIVDPLAIYLDVLDVTTSKGTYTVSPSTPQTVIVDIGTLFPGEIVTIVIRTVVNDNATPPPIDIVNRAGLEFNQGTTLESERNIIHVPYEGGDDDDDDEDEATPTPVASSPTSTPPPSTTLPTPTAEMLSVARLPETGQMPAQSLATYALFALLVLAVAVVGGWLWRGKRR